MSEKKQFYGLSQYKGPFNYELSGKHFRLVMDDGREFSLNFTDGENLQWAGKGEAYRWDTYEAMKGDDTTYFVYVRPAVGEGKLVWVFILDTLQSLVTMVVIEEGKVPEWPQLETITPYFGAIKVPGRALPGIRHHLSDRMAGHGIYWYYNPGKSLQHLYHGASNVRADSGPGRNILDDIRDKIAETSDAQEKEQLQAELKVWEASTATYPIFDEPAFHIWINDHLNLFGFLEENKMLYYPDHVGGGGILLLQDIERLVDIGLCYNRNDYYMLTAYGREETRHDPLMDVETPYDWSVLRGMPSLKWPVEHDE